jgi:hypothetical protein
VDVKRVVDLMSVAKEDKLAFTKQIRILEPGQFFALGRAVTKERLLLKIGPIETSHPESGKAAREAEPPPTPDAVKKILPTLSDLPKRAEEEAKTVAEFKAQIRTLKAQLREAPKANHTVTEKVADPRAIERAVNAAKSEYQKHLNELRKQLAPIGEALRKIRNVVEGLEDLPGIDFKAPAVTPTSLPSKEPLRARIEEIREHRRQRWAAHDAKPPKTDWVKDPPADGAVSKSQMRILTALAELENIGKLEPERATVAAWSKYSPNSGGFNNYVGALTTAGLIERRKPGSVSLTDAGRAITGHVDVPDREELTRRIQSVLNSSQMRILDAVVQGEQPVSREVLAERAGFQPNSGGYNNYIGAMRTAGFLEIPAPGQIKAADWVMEMVA